MTIELTVEQVLELTEIQAQFDERIAGKNLDDTSVAYLVEFFEWINAVEPFKNWKVKPGKSFEVQIDELADMLAFGLSLFNQAIDLSEDVDKSAFIESIIHELKGFGDLDSFEFNSPKLLNYIALLIDALVGEDHVITGDDIVFLLGQPFLLGAAYYTIDELIVAYKAKMERNHARQDGEADKDGGYAE